MKYHTLRVTLKQKIREVFVDEFLPDFTNMKNYPTRVIRREDSTIRITLKHDPDEKTKSSLNQHTHTHTTTDTHGYKTGSIPFSFHLIHAGYHLTRTRAPDGMP